MKMIAVPIDVPSQSGQPVSKLYGNVAYFALYDLQGQIREIVINESKGNGKGIADYLYELGVTQTLYHHLGDKLFDLLQAKRIAAFALHQRELGSVAAVRALLGGELTQVNESNASELLDPAGKSEACDCGCNH